MQQKRHQKNKLKEELYDSSNLTAYENFIKEYMRGIKDNDILSLVNAKTRDTFDIESPMFVLPNGGILSVSDVLEENNSSDEFEWVHHALPYCMIKQLLYKYGVEDLDGEPIEIDLEDIADDMLDIITYGLGWVRLNCGKTVFEDRFYCVLPNEVTSAQYRTLSDWLDWGYDNRENEVLVFATDSSIYHKYSFVDNMPEDIMKNIRRFYSSGTFYESVDSASFESLLSSFWKLTTDELLNYVKGDDDGYGAVWITPSGDCFEYDLHSSLGCEAFYNYAKDKVDEDTLSEYLDDWNEDGDAYNDHLVDDLGWVKFNVGLGYYEDRCYVCIPSRMTSKQYSEIEALIDYSVDEHQQNTLLILPQDSTQNHYYDISELTGRDIVKRIQRYYTSGVLEETLNEKIEHISCDEESMDYDYFFAMDSTSELKSFIDKSDWKEFRVIDSSNYDGRYYVCDARYAIHSNILSTAVEYGWFPDHNKMSVHSLFNDSDFLIVDKGKMADNGQLGEDGYYFMYVFDEYTILARDTIEDDKLLNTFGRLIDVKEFDDSLDEKVMTDNEIRKSLAQSYHKFMKKMGVTSKDAVEYVLNKYDEEDIETISKFISSLAFPLTVYRGLKGDRVDMSNPGMHWTIDRGLFSAKNSLFKNVDTILIGTLNEDDIDWKYTIDTFAHYSLRPSYGFYPEMEVTVKRGVVPNGLRKINKDELMNEEYNKVKCIKFTKTNDIYECTMDFHPAERDWNNDGDVYTEIISVWMYKGTDGEQNPYRFPAPRKKLVLTKYDYDDMISGGEIVEVDCTDGSSLCEGTWSLPDTNKKVKKLKSLMKSPINASDLKLIKDELYNILGDDDLYDNLNDAAEYASDLRLTIANYISSFLKRNRGLVSSSIADELEKIIAPFRDDIYESVIHTNSNDEPNPMCIGSALKVGDIFYDDRTNHRMEVISIEPYNDFGRTYTLKDLSTNITTKKQIGDLFVVELAVDGDIEVEVDDDIEIEWHPIGDYFD